MRISDWSSDVCSSDLGSWPARATSTSPARSARRACWWSSARARCEPGRGRCHEEDVMALDLRPNCERCDKDLPPSAADARICSYECTFCADCVETALLNVCPNCGGGFVPRPIRPATEWRPGVSLAHQPASAMRVHMKRSPDEAAQLTRRVRDRQSAVAGKRVAVS